MINVTQEDDNTFTISWDENDPGESIFNSFTEQDFIDLLVYYTKKELDKIENSSSTEEEYGETDNDAAWKEYCEASLDLQEEWEDYHQENNEAP
jgi:hypothetical protein